MHHHHRGGRFGRGPFGGPFEHGPFGERFGRGPFGRGPFGRGRSFFERGAIRFVLLGLLADGPMHGYEMIRRLEELSGGRYAPSPGLIYPTLQSLEDQGLVTSAEAGGKKVYSLTEAGKAAVAEQNERRGGHSWFGPHNAPEPDTKQRVLHREVADVIELLALAEREVAQNPAQLARLRAILNQARTGLTAMLYGEGEGEAEA